MRPVTLMQKFVWTILFFFLAGSVVQIYSMKEDAAAAGAAIDPQQTNLVHNSLDTNNNMPTTPQQQDGVPFVYTEKHGMVDRQRPYVPKPALPDEFYRAQDEVVVVMWDGGTPWGWADGPVMETPNYAGYRVVKPECPVKCTWTQDRSRVNEAEAVLFDVCGTGPSEYRDVPVYFPPKKDGQLWMWYAYEQKWYFPMLQQQEYLDMFDGHMSYHHDSLVHISYVCPWGGQADFLAPPPKKSKDKVAVFVASNCVMGGARERAQYVQELMKYMPVDSLGMCLNNKEHPTNRAKNQAGYSNGNEQLEKIRVIAQYKFLLAFENADNVTDYVTEKMVNSLQAGTVPVYRGAPNVDMWQPGEHSVIDVHNFPNPKALAEYLMKLNDDDDAYNEYFAWKQKGLSPQFQRLQSECLFLAECRLCKELSEIRVAENRTSRAQLGPLRAHALQFNRLDQKPLGKRFPGDDGVCVPHSGPLATLDREYSIMAWVNANLLGDGRIVDKNQAGAFDGFLMDFFKTGAGEGNFRFCAATNCFHAFRKVRVGIWYHVAAVFRPHPTNPLSYQILLYVNGKLDSTHESHAKTSLNTHPLCFGKTASHVGSWRGRHQGAVFDGVLDEISIWNRALTEQEIYRLRFASLSGNEPNLVGSWNFDEGEGTRAHDSSPNKLHGDFRGTPVWTVAHSKPLNDVSNLESA